MTNKLSVRVQTNIFRLSCSESVKSERRANKLTDVLKLLINFSILSITLAKLYTFYFSYGTILFPFSGYNVYTNRKIVQKLFKIVPF